MTWFKIDDDFAVHAKVVKAGNAAIGLWARAGAWCAQHLTDGFIPDHVISILGSPAQRRKLISVGLWVEGVGGCQFHEWNENGRQPTREKVLHDRSNSAARKAKSRKNLAENLEISEESQVRGGGHADATRDPRGRARVPDPTRPEEEEATTSVTAAAATHADPPADPDVGHQEGFWPASADVQEPAPEATARTAEDAEFEAWWAAWPRKVAKAKARSSYRAARKKVPADRLLAAAAQQLAAWREAGKALEFIPHATTWLNQERYNDEVVRGEFAVVSNPRSPLYGTKIRSSRSPWADELAGSL